METAFVGPNRTGPDRVGPGHATGRNGPGPKLKFGPAGRAGPWSLRAGPTKSGPCRSLLVIYYAIWSSLNSKLTIVIFKTYFTFVFVTFTIFFQNGTNLF